MAIEFKDYHNCVFRKLVCVHEQILLKMKELHGENNVKRT